MAVLYISEYDRQCIDYLRLGVPAPQEPSIAEQSVAIGGTSAASAAFNAKTKFVRVHTDAICSIAFGVSPTAVATAKRMAAGQTEFFGVRPGDKVAVITNT
jgi:hypothetical protein